MDGKSNEMMQKCEGCKGRLRVEEAHVCTFEDARCTTLFRFSPSIEHVSSMIIYGNCCRGKLHNVRRHGTFGAPPFNIEDWAPFYPCILYTSFGFSGKPPPLLLSLTLARDSCGPPLFLWFCLLNFCHPVTMNCYTLCMV